MKRIIYTLIVFMFVPAIAFGGEPAPYTDEALQKLFAAFHETPQIAPDRKDSKEEFHKQFLDYYVTIFDKAGYSFHATINKIVQDLQNNPDRIPKGGQSVYNKVYLILHLMMYQCDYDKIDCLQFFPEETKKSVQWLIANSDFSKSKANKHHTAKNTAE